MPTAEWIPVLRTPEAPGDPPHQATPAQPPGSLGLLPDPGVDASAELLLEQEKKAAEVRLFSCFSSNLCIYFNYIHIARSSCYCDPAKVEARNRLWRLQQNRNV